MSVHLTPSPRILNRIWHKHGLLWLGYGLLTIALTWPTVRHFTTHLPGDGGDDPAIAWNLWWVKHALLNLGQEPFYTDFMFYPIGINLAFYTLTVLNALTSLPLLLNFGVVTAGNLHTLFTFVVGGYGAFLLIRYLLAAQFDAVDNRTAWLIAAVTGGFYAFAGSKLFYIALGQFNIGSSHWIPLAVLYVIKSRQQPTRLKNAAMAGLFLSMQAWTEMTYASFLLVFIGLYWLYQMITPSQPPPDRGRSKNLPTQRGGIEGGAKGSQTSIRAHLTAAAVMLALFGLGLTPLLAAMLPDMQTEGDFLVEGSGFAGAFSADLLGFVIPTMHHPLFGDWIAATNITAFDKGQHIYLGVTLLTLALPAAVMGRRQPHLRFWLLAALVFGLLTLGPVIMVNGLNSGLPGPFVIFQYLPFFKGNRYPSRYSVMLLLSLSVLAAYALLWFSQRLKRPAATNAVILLAGSLFLFEHLSAPLPQSDMRIPPAYQQIAADPAAITVLDIPFAWRNGFTILGALTPQFMFGQFYQTAHQKRLLQGNTSRNPALKFDYFARAPVINSLLALETGKPLPDSRLAADRPIAAEVLRFFDIGYIVVRPEPDNPFGHNPQATMPYIERLLPVEKIHDDPQMTIYRVQPPAAPPATLTIDSNSPLAPLYLGEGWGLIAPGQPLAAQRRSVRLMLPLTGHGQQLTLRLRPPTGLTNQSLTVALNGWQSPPQPLESGRQTVTVDLPSGTARPGLNDLYLNFAQVMTLPPQPVQDITVHSAGEDVGGFGHIYVNGRDLSSNQRGYNIVIIPPDPAAPPQTAAFDTHLDPAAGIALAEFLRSAPPESTIALAAADEAGANLSDEAVAAIRQVTGATGDLRGCFRCSHAIIAHPSQPPQENLDPLQPVSLTTNHGLTEPTIAALIDYVALQTASE